MKYVAPLFHPTCGRVGVGPQNWDTFQLGFRVVFRGSKFIGASWDEWWEPRVRGEKRKTERRQTGDRRSDDGQVRMRSCGPQEIWLLFGEHRSRMRPRTERRVSTNKTEFTRLADWVRTIRESGSLTDDACSLLADFFCELCSGAGFDDWEKKLSPFIMFAEPGWSESEHRVKFRDYAIACCFDALRPGILGWRENPNSNHMELVSRFADLFPSAPPGSRRKALRDFFEGRSDLFQTIRILEPGKLAYPMNALLLVSLHMDLKPKDFFEKLQDQLRRLGVRLSPNPNSYRTQMRRLKQAAKDFEGRFGNPPTVT